MLLRTKARSVSFIVVVEVVNIAPVGVTVRCLGAAEYEKLGGRYAFRLNKMIEANRRQNSIRRMSDYGMAVSEDISERSAHCVPMPS